mmetsp:Transcript_43967/g.81675  ORF Transcript_43967/g.81675 Transcript_43967/m.81675 type:complete len:276 (+) Transcript_43967:1658-2485(+)
MIVRKSFTTSKLRFCISPCNSRRCSSVSKFCFNAASMSTSNRQTSAVSTSSHNDAMYWSNTLRPSTSLSVPGDSVVASVCCTSDASCSGTKASIASSACSKEAFASKVAVTACTVLLGKPMSMSSCTKALGSVDVSVVARSGSKAAEDGRDEGGDIVWANSACSIFSKVGSVRNGNCCLARLIRSLENPISTRFRIVWASISGWMLNRKDSPSSLSSLRADCHKLATEPGRVEAANEAPCPVIGESPERRFKLCTSGCASALDAAARPASERSVL